MLLIPIYFCFLTLQGNTIEPWYKLGINVAGGVCIALWTATWGLLIFYPLNYFNLLRINPQIEFKGMDLTEHGEAAYPVDAWVELQYKDQDGTRRSVPSVMNGTLR
jgi:ammonia channel protein AmtB